LVAVSISSSWKEIWLSPISRLSRRNAVQRRLFRPEDWWHGRCAGSDTTIECPMSIVLLVDDDADNLRALQEVIETAGHEVVPAADGADALDKLDKFNPQIIISDWQMPGIDGWALCSRVRDLPQYTRLPVVLLSANVVPLGENGCWSVFFRKPVDLEILLRCVQELCSVSRISHGTYLIGLGPASSRWQPVDTRCWP
jgi:CheY-like chemotaxis protein